jgi:hypothetical protein
MQASGLRKRLQAVAALGGSQQDELCRREIRNTLELRGEHEPVAVGHLIVDDDDIERFAGAMRLAQRLQRIGTTRRLGDLEARRFQLSAQHATVRRVVVHHEHPPALLDNAHHPGGIRGVIDRIER